MINIKPQNKGKFTDWANSHNMSVQQAASKIMANTEAYSPTLVKRANFAKNAAGWKHAMGGTLKQYQLGTTYENGVPETKVLGDDFSISNALRRLYLDPRNADNWMNQLGRLHPITQIARGVASGIGNIGAAFGNKQWQAELDAQDRIYQAQKKLLQQRGVPFQEGGTKKKMLLGDLDGLTEEEMMNGPVNGFIGNVIPEEMPYMSSIPTYSQLLEQYSPQMQAQPIAYMPPKEAMKLILDDIKQQATPKKKIDKPSKKKITSNNAAPANNNNSNEENWGELTSQDLIGPHLPSYNKYMYDKEYNAIVSSNFIDIVNHIGTKVRAGYALTTQEVNFLKANPKILQELQKQHGNIFDHPRLMRTFPKQNYLDESIKKLPLNPLMY